MDGPQHLGVLYTIKAHSTAGSQHLVPHAVLCECLVVPPVVHSPLLDLSAQYPPQRPTCQEITDRLAVIIRSLLQHNVFYLEVQSTRLPPWSLVDMHACCHGIVVAGFNFSL